jgi:WD40 repeat protein
MERINPNIPNKIKPKQTSIYKMLVFDSPGAKSPMKDGKDQPKDIDIIEPRPMTTDRTVNTGNTAQTEHWIPEDQSVSQDSIIDYNNMAPEGSDNLSCFNYTDSKLMRQNTGPFDDAPNNHDSDPMQKIDIEISKKRNTI